MSKRNQQPKKHKVLSLKPYFGIAYVTQDKDEFIRLQKWFFADKPLVDPTDDDDHTTFGIALRAKSKRTNGTVCIVLYDTIPTLVHELTHIALGIFRTINADPREDAEEPFCYLLDHLVAQALGTNNITTNR